MPPGVSLRHFGNQMPLLPRYPTQLLRPNQIILARAQIIHALCTRAQTQKFSGSTKCVFTKKEFPLSLNRYLTVAVYKASNFHGVNASGFLGR